MQKCKICGREYIYDRKKGHRREKCNYCMVKSYRKKMKKYLISLLGGKCEKCGYNRCVSALEFHHKDPLKKDFTLSGSKVLSIKKMEAEVKKCNLLCANCHREEHEKIASSIHSIPYKVPLA